ncbi:pseudouridine synthase [Methylobacillus gramineus]|uniref:23S rRNA pseudouridine(2605) synthase RluB n=1 Tax=Methylobacillus gramineus TaxID=755169 RepID=UPI001CFFAD85|nr:pseudouridine synthase [Methylobacillus gramineus]MCB5184727.1 pseudouridine synthase [Methylobacillus gramineus]
MARPFKQQRNPRNTSFKPVVADPDAVPQRLHKLLALSGLGSRREMETLIESGRITINGKVAIVGAAVVLGDVVRLDSRPLHLPFEAELPQVLIYHKPEGEIVTQDDPEKRATVFDKLPPVRGAKWIAVGRLDMNTSGLLIFTTSGELANRFMHPRYEVEREYAVRIFGELSDEEMLQLTQGIELDDGPANFDSIRPQGGEGSNHWYEVILREGRNREVRRLFEAFQKPVSRLIRVRFGPVNLPPRVKRGQMLHLDAKEVTGLLEWAELELPKTPLKQLSPREKEKIGKVFTPKARKSRFDSAEPASVESRGPRRVTKTREESIRTSRDRPARTGERTESQPASASREEARARPADTRRDVSNRNSRGRKSEGQGRATTSAPKPRKPANRRIRQAGDVPVAKPKRAGK